MLPQNCWCFSALGSALSVTTMPCTHRHTQSTPDCHLRCAAHTNPYPNILLPLQIMLQIERVQPVIRIWAHAEDLWQQAGESSLQSQQCLFSHRNTRGATGPGTWQSKCQHTPLHGPARVFSPMQEFNGANRAMAWEEPQAVRQHTSEHIAEPLLLPLLSVTALDTRPALHFSSWMCHVPLQPKSLCSSQLKFQNHWSLRWMSFANLSWC